MTIGLGVGIFLAVVAVAIMLRSTVEGIITCGDLTKGSWPPPYLSISHCTDASDCEWDHSKKKCVPSGYVTPPLVDSPY